MDMRKVGPAPLDQKVTARLLDLLSTDDKFRQLFKDDAAAALAQVGYNVGADEASAAYCMQLRTSECLASKDKIARDRIKLEKTLSSVVGFDCKTAFSAD